MAACSNIAVRVGCAGAGAGAGVYSGVRGARDSTCPFGGRGSSRGVLMPRELMSAGALDCYRGLRHLISLPRCGALFSSGLACGNY